jgi:hypothetical protein
VGGRLQNTPRAIGAGFLRLRARKAIVNIPKGSVVSNFVYVRHPMRVLGAT